ncbi:MAG: ATP synthase F1 subunit epsilon, partial [Prolixibacteraceae bacterium]|nr:ATP synthase F1 subunit epsilon [Prolixibacteraceae bacterium]
MHLEIITPIAKLYSDEVRLVKLPGVKGSFEILKNHAPIVSSLEEGTIKIIDANKKEVNYEISGGVIECKSNKIVVLA